MTTQATPAEIAAENFHGAVDEIEGGRDIAEALAAALDNAVLSRHEKGLPVSDHDVVCERFAAMAAEKYPEITDY